MFKLENIIDKTRKVYVIDIELSTKESYSLTELCRQGKEIDFNFLLVGCNSIDDVISYIPPESAVGIIISGKGIIYRQINTNDIPIKAKLLNHILPDADINDFYLQLNKINSENNSSIISIARKSVINSFIKIFGKKNFIVGLSIGPFIFNSIIPLLENHCSTIKYKNTEININENSIIGFQLTENIENKILKIDNKEFSSELLPSLSLGFSILMKELCNYAEIPEVHNYISENRYRHSCIKIIRYTIPIIFFILMVSYILFDHYYNKVNTLNTEIQESELLINQIESLQATYISKNKFLQQSGLLGQTQISYYLDLIAQEIPETIVLSEINVNPIEKNDSFKEKIIFKRNKIELIGSSIDSYIFNSWIKKLKDINSFKDINIIQYEYKEKENKADFTITINI